jgi:hypothetical protein
MKTPFSIRYAIRPKKYLTTKTATETDSSFCEVITEAEEKFTHLNIILIMMDSKFVRNVKSKFIRTAEASEVLRHAAIP